MKDHDAPESESRTASPFYRELHDGAQDGLIPLKSIDLEKIQDFDQLLDAMALTAFGGRNLGEAAEVLDTMLTDPECSVVLTLSGAMTVAKMGLVITEMIERGWVQAIVSTGALMTHGLVELAGMEHYKARDDARDDELFRMGYNRVYDTYEMEKNLNELERLLETVFEALPQDARFGSRELCQAIGRHLDRPGSRGVMVAAFRQNVPIYIPAFSDSELGLDLATFLIRRDMARNGASIDQALGHLESSFDPFKDLGHYARFVSRTPRLGIFTIGGGVPRNWAQQAPPFLDILTTATGHQVRLNRFRYGVRICPEPVHWGGLSGCTYSEGMSWGKFMPISEGGRYAEVYADATIAWPILVKAVAQRLDKTGRKAVHPDLG